MAVPPPHTAEETKAPQSLDAQDQPCLQKPYHLNSPSEQGHTIPISESLVPPNRTRSGRAIHPPEKFDDYFC